MKPKIRKHKKPNIKNVCKKVITLFALYIICYTPAKAQSIEWTKNFSPLNDSTYCANVMVGKDGKVYAAGWFHNSLNLGNGHTLTGGWDGFLAQFDTAGNCQWAQKINVMSTGCSCDNRSGLQVVGFDPTGNIIVTGTYCGCGENFGNSITSSNTGYNLFVAKYNTSGLCQWAKTKQGYYDASTSSPYDAINCATVDKNGNVYLDVFNYVSNSTFCGLSLASQGEYLVKINNNSIGVWKLFHGYSTGYAFTCLQSSKNRIYGGAQFVGTVSLGTNTVTSQSNSVDVAVIKMDTAGNVLASTICQTSGTDLSYSVAVSNNSVVLLGKSGASTLTAGTHTLNTGSGQDVTFLIACDTTSLNIQALNNVSGSNTGRGYGLYNDNKGNMYLTATNSGTISYGSLSNVPAGEHIIKIDNTLNYYWHVDVACAVIAPDTLGNIYATYNNYSGSNLQLSKIKNAYTTGITGRQMQNTQMQVYPNPSSTLFNLQLGVSIKNSNAINIYLYDVSGRQLNALQYTQQDTNTLQIDLSNYTPGTYLLKAEIDGLWYSAKLER